MDHAEKISFMLKFVFTGTPISIVLVILYNLFIFIQQKTFMSTGDLLFVSSGFLKWVFALYGFTVFFIIMSREETGYYPATIYKIITRLGIIKVLLILSVIFLIIVTQMFSTYTKVNENEIASSNGFIHKTQNYSWKDINNAEVYCTYSTKRSSSKVQLHYVLKFKNDKEIDLGSSRQFWKNILKVDNILTKKGTIISRGLIDYGTSLRILNDSYSYKENEDVLKKIIYVVDTPPIHIT
ncbi:hypothetical protein Cpap_3638 [Ruminiclostridium papyrosolvens DSM 2782]|uniref:Uncharacterized protein n=2 Tax=Ruminiclostridium papyrosolvens TaxID=29362 RepID=F1T9M4_9FIRM|nr:hypothetical protein [Ruminiclostridium papyrosolvens]EGD49206.1 hypothetical protein Cpap_3638 [Ruminiclostridium papyrosolvens DSM 2782]